MRVLYKPIQIIAALLGARLGRRAFERLWAKIDGDPPPDASTADASLPKILTATILEAATMAGVAATVDRTFARVFHYLTGIWPGAPQEQKPDEK